MHPVLFDLVGFLIVHLAAVILIVRSPHRGPEPIAARQAQVA